MRTRAAPMPATPTPAPWRLGLCVLVAAALHGALLFGVDLPPPAAPGLPPTIAVRLVPTKTAAPPAAPAPAPVPADEKRLPVAAVSTLPAALPVPAAEEPLPQPAPANRKLAGKSALALARAVVLAETDGLGAVPPAHLEQTAPASADLAYYLDAWRRKVERIGQLNYPAEAKAKGLAGTLKLRVRIAADGALDDVRILVGSGHTLLDDAAVRIVRLAAPYAQFSPTMRATTEVLEIERTWQFRNSRLSS